MNMVLSATTMAVTNNGTCEVQRYSRVERLEAALLFLLFLGTVCMVPLSFLPGFLSKAKS